jgi:transketolase
VRTTFINELVELARIRKDVFLVVGDLGFSVVEPFAREFPDRFLNAGVAEQNMTGVAAGLASEGWHVFTYSIANFPTFRCAEQIRNDVAYHNLPVTVVAVGGGVAYGNLGYSHHAVQDYALLRTFPGMLVAAPGDPAETRACLRYLVANPQPSYLRLGKAGEPLVHTSGVEVEPGRLLSFAGQPKAPGLLLTTGAMLRFAHSIWKTLPSGRWHLASLPLWAEHTKAQLVADVARFSFVVTVEDHLRAGGFGGYIQEALADAGMTIPIHAMALSAAVCGDVATQTVLNVKGGLSEERLRVFLSATD